MFKIIKIILLSLLVVIIIGALLIFSLYLRRPNFFKSSFLVLKGAAYSERHLEDRAIGFYREAGKIDPDNPLVYDAIARSYARMGLWNESIEYLKKAIEKAPENERFYKVIFSFYMGRDLDEEAKAYFEGLLRQNPSNELAAKYLRLVQGYEMFIGRVKERQKEKRK